MSNIKSVADGSRVWAKYKAVLIDGIVNVRRSPNGNLALWRPGRDGKRVVAKVHNGAIFLEAHEFGKWISLGEKKDE